MARYDRLNCLRTSGSSRYGPADSPCQEGVAASQDSCRENSSSRAIGYTRRRPFCSGRIAGQRTAAEAAGSGEATGTSRAIECFALQEMIAGQKLNLCAIEKTGLVPTGHDCGTEASQNIFLENGGVGRCPTPPAHDGSSCWHRPSPVHVCLHGQAQWATYGMRGNCTVRCPSNNNRLLSATYVYSTMPAITHPRSQPFHLGS